MVLQFLRQKSYDVANQSRAREQYRKAYNSMFQREFEANVIRPLALELASREFPVDDSADSRYTALFAAHGFEEFDTRRCSFLVYGGNHSKRRLTQSLSRIAQSLDPSSVAFGLFHDWVAAYKHVSESRHSAPEGFADAAWQTYRHTVCSPHYYLSVSEMLLFARLLELPLVVTTHNGDGFQIVGHTISGAFHQEVVYITLGDNDKGAVRGHFERIWPAFELQQCSEAYEVERRCRVEQQRREESERQRMATEDQNILGLRPDALCADDSELEEMERSLQEQIDLERMQHAADSYAATRPENDLPSLPVAASSTHSVPVSSARPDAPCADGSDLEEMERSLQEQIDLERKQHVADYYAATLPDNYLPSPSVAASSTHSVPVSSARPVRPAGAQWTPADTSNFLTSLGCGCGASNARTDGAQEIDDAGYELSDSSTEPDSEGEELYFQVATDSSICNAEPVEQDMIRQRCARLRGQMRLRPCLPSKNGEEVLSSEELSAGVQLPLYSCPWRGCTFATNDRALFLHHVAGGVSDPIHKDALQLICQEDLPWMTFLDYVYGAVAIAERERWPLLGLSVTRRSLNLLCQRFNDATTQCLACFVCGQLRTTCTGYPEVDLNTPVDHAGHGIAEIRARDIDWFAAVEKKCPGTLLNNCSYELWRRRYVLNNSPKNATRYPWGATHLLS